MLSEILSRGRRPSKRCCALGLRRRPKLAFHAPCTPQHGLRIRGTVERLLEAAGYELTPVADSHLCCGSAGDLFPASAGAVEAVAQQQAGGAGSGRRNRIASANIGCISHLEAGTATPVVHWVEMLEARPGRGSEMQAVDEACPVAATRLASTLQTVSSRASSPTRSGNAGFGCERAPRRSSGAGDPGWHATPGVFRRCPIGGRSGPRLLSCAIRQKRLSRILPKWPVSRNLRCEAHR